MRSLYMLDLFQLREPGINYICYRNPADIRFSWPVKTSRWPRWLQEVDLHVLLHSVNLLNNTNLPTSLTTPIYHFLSYLHATYSFRPRDSVVILPKHAFPVMLNEPASASSSAVRLYALEFTGLKKWYFLVSFFNSSQTSFILSIEI